MGTKAASSPSIATSRTICASVKKSPCRRAPSTCSRATSPRRAWRTAGARPCPSTTTASISPASTPRAFRATTILPRPSYILKRSRAKPRSSWPCGWAATPRRVPAPFGSRTCPCAPALPTRVATSFSKPGAVPATTMTTTPSGTRSTTSPSLPSSSGRRCSPASC